MSETSWRHKGIITANSLPSYLPLPPSHIWLCNSPAFGNLQSLTCDSSADKQGRSEPFIWMMNSQPVRTVEDLYCAETGQSCRRGSLHSDLGKVWGGLSAVPVLNSQGLQDSKYVCSRERQTHPDKQKSYILQCTHGLEDLRDIGMINFHFSNEGLPQWMINWQISSRNW